MHNSFWGTLYILTTQICISRYIDRVMVLVHTIKQQHNVRKIGSRDHNKNSQFAQQKIKSPTPQTCLLLPACVVVPLSPVPNSSWILSRFSMCTKKIYGKYYQHYTSIGPQSNGVPRCCLLAMVLLIYTIVWIEKYISMLSDRKSRKYNNDGALCAKT